ncbi:MAG: MFS transporter [Actinomycetaceae bacterium]|nr:MFS transporter [Actinomycetaceae bacterium]
MSQTTTDQQLTEKGFASYLPIIIACCTMCGVPSAILISSASVFYEPIANEFNVEIARISVWMSCMLISCAIFSPLMGSLIARYDIRPLLLAGATLEAAIFALFSVSQGPWMFWVGGFLAGLSNIVLLGMATATLVNRWFKTHVGVIIGFCTAFTGLGGVLFLPLAQKIIATHGWRTAYLTFAIITFVVTIPVILICVRSNPSERGLLPYGTAEAARNSSDGNVAEPTSVRPSVGMRSSVFWIVIVFGFFVNLVCQIPGYFPRYVSWINEQADSGLATKAFIAGATLAAVAQAGNAIGKIGLGFFSDLSVSRAIAVLSGAGALGIIFVWQFPSTILLPIGSLIFGFFIAGVLVLCPMVARRIFGAGKYYPVFYARISVAVTLGGAAGNVVWPYVAEHWGGFGTVFAIALGAIVVVVITGFMAYAQRDRLPRE